MKFHDEFEFSINSVIGRLQSDFKREIGSLGSNVIDTDRLTSGAKIRRIFHERLSM